MCLVCLEFQKDKMTKIEAVRAFNELVTFPSPSSSKEEQEHFKEMINSLSEKEPIDMIDYYDLMRLEEDGG